MRIKKSSRHSKITGNFCENVILYWLSKYGYECANVDHVGIDIIARNPRSSKVMGISVKGRSRNLGKEKTPLSIPNKNFYKIKKACKAFNCVPYFAFVIDGKNKIYSYIISMEHLIKSRSKGRRTFNWKMRAKDIVRYARDKKIMKFEFDYKTTNWR